MGKSKYTRGVNTPIWQAAIVCCVGASFYFYDFFLQSLPGVINIYLLQDLKIDASLLGVLSGAYFLTYTPMQLVAGLLYDLYGPRVLLTIMVFVCALGAIIFSLSHGILFAISGRTLMGFSSAFAFVCAIGLISRWFDKKLFAMLTGLVQAVSSLGAISASIPLAILVEHFNWRQVTFYIGVFGLFLSFIIFIIVKDEPKFNKKNNKKKVMTPYKQYKTKRSLLKEEMFRLRCILQHRHTWVIALYAFVMWALMPIFTEMWGISYLMRAFNLSQINSNEYISLVWISVAIFSPLIGWFSEKCKSRLLPMRLAAIIGIISILMILFVPGMPKYVLLFCLFCLGIAPAAAILSFAVVKDYNHENLGAAIGFNNMMIVMPGLIFTPLIGVILDFFGKYNSESKSIIYSVNSYQIGLSIIPVCLFIGLILSIFFIKETNCEYYKIK